MTWRVSITSLSPWARLGIRLVVAAGLLGYLFRRVPMEGVAATLAEARPMEVAAACVAFLGGVFLASQRLELLTDRLGLKLSLRRLFAVNLGTGFYGLFLPGGTLTGGAIRYYKITRTEGQRVRALAAIAFERIVATLFLCVMGVALWAVELPTENGPLGVVMSVALAAVLVLYLSLASSHVSIVLMSVLTRLGLASMASGVRKLFDAFQQYQKLSRGSITAVAALSIGVHAAGILAYRLLGASVGIDVSFVTIGWIRSAVLLITMLPVSIGGFGVREGAFLMLLRPYGASGEQALALSLLVFAVRLIVFGGLGGLVELRALVGRAERAGASGRS